MYDYELSTDLIINLIEVRMLAILFTISDQLDIHGLENRLATSTFRVSAVPALSRIWRDSIPS